MSPAPPETDAAARRSVRLWLKLLAAASGVERSLGRRLRAGFGSTLPRFDVLAALDRAGPSGLPLSELSARLRVTKGAVTGLAERLRRDGLIAAVPDADRRVQRVALTAEGAARFAEMARAHARWVDALFADLAPEEVERLSDLLDRARASVARHEEPAP